MRLATLRLIAATRKPRNRLGKKLVLKPGQASIHHDLATVTRDLSGFALSGEDKLQMLMDVNENNKALKTVSSEISAIVEQSLTNQVKLVRNTVIPAVDAYTEAVVEAVDGWARRSDEESFTVNRVEVYPILLKNPELFDLERYLQDSKHSLGKPTYINDLPVHSAYETLPTMLQTENSSLLVWLAGIGKATFDSYAKNIFLGRRLPSSLERKEHYVSSKINKAMVGVLLAKAYLANIPSSVESSLQEYNSSLKYIRNGYGSVLAANVKIVNGYVTSNRLISTEDKINRTVYVVGPVYDAWMSNEGSIEALFGKMLSEDKFSAVNKINSKIMQYTALWTKHNSLVLSRKAKDKISAIKRTMLTVLELNKEGYTDLEKEYMITLDSDFKRRAIQMGKKVINELTDLETHNIRIACMKVLCLSRFSFTGAYEFLTSMEAAKEANPDASPSVLATIALTNQAEQFIKDCIVEVN